MAHSQCCEPNDFLPIYGCLPDFLKHDSYYGELGFRCELCDAWCQANQPWDVRGDSHLMSEAHFRRMGRWLLARYGKDYNITWTNLLDHVHETLSENARGVCAIKGVDHGMIVRAGTGLVVQIKVPLN